MRISDWSSDVCSSDLLAVARNDVAAERRLGLPERARQPAGQDHHFVAVRLQPQRAITLAIGARYGDHQRGEHADPQRSEEHTSELQSLMRNSYAVFCLKKKKTHHHKTRNT